jgi:hypothetical protein
MSLGPAIQELSPTIVHIFVDACASGGGDNGHQSSLNEDLSHRVSLARPSVVALSLVQSWRSSRSFCAFRNSYAEVGRWDWY